jgi:hypothetical protein
MAALRHRARQGAGDYFYPTAMTFEECRNRQNAHSHTDLI